MTSIPIFLELLDCTDNPVWIRFFQNLASGISHHPSISIDMKQHCLLYKKSKISFHNVTPFQLFQSIYDLILSKDEKLFSKKKVIKDSLIEFFIIEQSTLHHLSIAFTKKLVSIILLAFLFKTLNSKHIHFTNGQISKIDGLTFFPKKVTIHKSILNIFSSPKLDSLSIKQQKTLSSYWFFYLQEQ